MLSKTFCGVLVFCLAASCLWGQEKQEKKEQEPPAGASSSAAGNPPSPHGFNISAEDAARKNPVKFTQTSVDRGKKIYLTQCALCHGAKGDGKGELAEEMKISPPDLTKPETLKDRKDGELFAIIGVGKEPMPSQSGRMTDQHRWNLVNYLRALGGKTPEKATGKELEENIILIPQ
jgi:mono/diheme cytochrome c family protein